MGGRESDRLGGREPGRLGGREAGREWLEQAKKSKKKDDSQARALLVAIVSSYVFLDRTAQRVWLNALNMSTTAAATTTSTTSATVDSVAKAILDEIKQPVSQQDAAFAAVLNLQTALCAQVEALTQQLRQIPRTAETAREVSVYMQKIDACRSRLWAVNKKLDAIESRMETSEGLLLAVDLQ